MGKAEFCSAAEHGIQRQFRRGLPLVGAERLSQRLPAEGIGGGRLVRAVLRKKVISKITRKPQISPISGMSKISGFANAWEVGTEEERVCFQAGASGLGPPCMTS